MARWLQLDIHTSCFVCDEKDYKKIFIAKRCARGLGGVCAVRFFGTGAMVGENG